MKNRGIAVLLAIFLGFIGMQHFYLGNVSYGMLSLLFCWTGIPFLLGIIHAFILWGMGERRFQNKYSR
jgi:TM2 domain-containing membrane protein YozV